jgi:hypothetical protein
MFCAKCGCEASDDAQFCQKCGVTLKESPIPTKPVVINGVTYTPAPPNSGHAGLYMQPKKGWVKIENGVVIRASVHKPVTTGRIITGSICIAVAGLAALQGWFWISSYMELENAGNQFAGFLVPLILGAFVVTAGFGIGGYFLITPRK